jgi:hypothetical protein
MKAIQELSRWLCWLRSRIGQVDNKPTVSSSRVGLQRSPSRNLVGKAGRFCYYNSGLYKGSSHVGPNCREVREDVSLQSQVSVLGYHFRDERFLY